MEERTELQVLATQEQDGREPSDAAQIKHWRKDLALSLKYGFRAALATGTAISALSNGYDLDPNTKLLPTAPAYAQPDADSAPQIQVLSPEEFAERNKVNERLAKLAELISSPFRENLQNGPEVVSTPAEVMRMNMSVQKQILDDGKTQLVGERITEDVISRMGIIFNKKHLSSVYVETEQTDPEGKPVRDRWQINQGESDDSFTVVHDNNGGQSVWSTSDLGSLANKRLSDGELDAVNEKVKIVVAAMKESPPAHA